MSKKSRKNSNHWRNAKLCVYTLSLLTVESALAADSLEQRLQNFQANPQALLNAIPSKTSVSGGTTKIPFGKIEVRSKRYIEAKNKGREVLSGRAAIKLNDDPAALVDRPQNMITNLEIMDRQKLTKGEVAVQPWSDYYWALYNGQTAFRYADNKFPATTEDWKLKSDFLLSTDAQAASIDLLSPAEKYDLLVGDDRKTLTQHALTEGEQYYRSNGKVETWMGICHGWAPAAYMLERPTNAVKVLAADGKTRITFYPADIKALASLLWAVNSPATRFIGGRCNTKDPKTDKNGRVKDQNCFDTNPGAWHQAVVNQIGVSKRSFVMDATFDYEVWNQPVRSYSYSYFNPKTLRPVKTMKDGLVELKAFSEDRFKAYRSKKSKYVVGISMDVEYIVETEPTQSKNDGPSRDAIQKVSYEYDLELDDQMKIVGGEWYVNAHPDFLWTPEEGARAMTIADESIRGSWDGKSALPREWQDLAPRASQSGSPLASVVEALVSISRKNGNP